MIIQFQTADNSLWFIDTEELYWARIDRPAENPESVPLESGMLTNLNYGRYALAPRTPQTEGPGNGLSNIAVMPVVHGTTVIVCLSANVPVKEFTMPVPVKEIIYEIISEKAVDDSGQAGKSNATRVEQLQEFLESVPVPEQEKTVRQVMRETEDGNENNSGN